MSDALNLDALSPRLKKLIAYVFEHTFNPDLPDQQAKVGAIGVGIEDLFYILNMAARSELSDAKPPTIIERQ